MVVPVGIPPPFARPIWAFRSVWLTNRSVLGGVCLNVGCIPSKTLLHAATVIEEAVEIAEFGVDFAAPKIDLERVLAKKNAVIEQLTSGLDGLCKARKITRLTGKGVFKNTTTLVVTGPEGEQEVQCANVIIATGSHPFMLPNIPDGSTYLGFHRRS